MGSDGGIDSIIPYLPTKRLLGKVAVITGGARGIGAATAKAFAENGAHVIIADILDEPGAKLAYSIGGRYTHCDVSDEHDVERAIRLAVDWKGRLDIMFNNAGISGPEGSITNLKTEHLMSLLAINLNGVVHGIKHAARAMIESGNRGSIICSSSSAALIGGLASHAYTLSKEAILGLARSTACELGAHGIRVNCVSPHGVPSEMLVSGYKRFLGNPNLQPEDVRKIVGDSGSLLQGRGASVEDVAQGVLFLASDDAGFITGHNLVIDGGYTSGNNQMRFIYQG
ncbi:short-chain dehydrogenase reductase 3b [Phtheirospermum japonicum]|uniref:Short-chain dehydrogenase reductase 3b n=1 Tax=Phtheirospermum japonicum TaxID=374723 RepID=A0A830BM25_9LAMI|nr:short-chain dehydrogenase reductase 3b [Phtheirospermum japonicum]